jgi:hypothetical protein
VTPVHIAARDGAANLNRNQVLTYLPAAFFAGAAVEAARFTAHLFLSASESLFRPSAVMPPLRVALLAGADGAAFFAAHLALSASESLFRPSGVIPPFRFALRGRPTDRTAVGAGVSKSGPSMPRKAAKARSIPICCCSSFLITSLRLFAIFPLPQPNGID